MTKSKKAALPLPAAVLAMVTMLATQQARISRSSGAEGVELIFEFAARQKFSLTFAGDALVSAKMYLVEGREPTTQAMLAVQNCTSVDTVALFEELESNDLLEVIVVSQEGFSLETDGASFKDVVTLSPLFANMLSVLLKVDLEPKADAWIHVENERLAMALANQRRAARATPVIYVPG